MACFSYDNSLGLNQISLFQLNYNRDNHTHKRNNIEIQMDKKSGLSRIPKLSSKAVAEGNRVPSRGSTPVGGSRYSVKSAPASQEASPVVSRSKSLRLPRKQYGASGLSSNSASKMDSVTGKIFTYVCVFPVQYCMVCVHGIHFQRETSWAGFNQAMICVRDRCSLLLPAELLRQLSWLG